MRSKSQQLMNMYMSDVTADDIKLASKEKVRIPAFMPSSIALGCNGYEAHMQQILTPCGV